MLPSDQQRIYLEPIKKSNHDGLQLADDQYPVEYDDKLSLFSGQSVWRGEGFP